MDVEGDACWEMERGAVAAADDLLGAGVDGGSAVAFGSAAVVFVELDGQNETADQYRLAKCRVSSVWHRLSALGMVVGLGNGVEYRRRGIGWVHWAWLWGWLIVWWWWWWDCRKWWRHMRMCHLCRTIEGWRRWGRSRRCGRNVPRIVHGCKFWS